jgi:hypothetical protein
MKFHIKTIFLSLLLFVIVGCKEECERRIPQRVADTLCQEWPCDPDMRRSIVLGGLVGFTQAFCLEIIKEDSTYDFHCKGHFIDKELIDLCWEGISEFFRRCKTNSCQSQQKISVFQTSVELNSYTECSEEQYNSLNLNIPVF